MPVLVCIFLSVLIFLIYVIRNDLKLLKNEFSFGVGRLSLVAARRGHSSCGALAYHCVASLAAEHKL